MARDKLQEARERIQASFRYEPETGAIIRIARGGGSAKVGESAVSGPNKGGYLLVSCGGELFYAHRVAWLLAHGVAPEGQIDHINGNRQDNRLSNLRDVSNRLNSHNRRPFGGRYVIGVCWDKRKRKWRAGITHHGKEHFLGYRGSQEEAYALYLSAKPAFHEGAIA